MSIFSGAPKPYSGRSKPFSSFLGPEDKHRPSPTLAELDEILDTLKIYDPVRARYAKKHLKWVEKASDKYLGLKLRE